MDKFKNFRKESRENWGRNLPDGSELTDDQLKLGAIFRIADSIEEFVRSERRWYRERYEVMVKEQGKERAQTNRKITKLEETIKQLRLNKKKNKK